MTEHNRRRKTKDRYSDSDFDKVRNSSRNTGHKSEVSTKSKSRKSFSLFSITRPNDKQKKSNPLDKSSMPRFNELLLDNNSNISQSKRDKKSSALKQLQNEVKTNDVKIENDDNETLDQFLRQLSSNLEMKNNLADSKNNHCTPQTLPSEQPIDCEECLSNNRETNVNNHVSARYDEADENYRKSAFLEIDNIIEQMKKDHFLSENSDTSNDSNCLGDGDDFETYILDENGENYIVEAYNDIGNELVLTFLDITRKSVSIDPDSPLEKGFKVKDELGNIEDNTSILLHRQENEHTYQELFNYNGNIPLYEKKSLSQKREEKSKSFPNSKQNSFYIDEAKSEEEQSEPLYMNLEDPNLDKSVFNVNIVSYLEATSNPSKEIPKRNEEASVKEVNDAVSDVSECHSKRTSGYESSSQENQENPSENLEEREVDDVPVRRSTICDNSGNVRIEKISKIQDEPYPQVLIEKKSDSMKSLDKKKADYIIEELIQSEGKYLSDLEKIVREYKPYIERKSEIHPWLYDKAAYIFGNIDTIYDHAGAFHEKLKECDTINDVAWTFISFEKMFALYPLYSKNKPKSEQYMKQFQPFIKERQQQLGDRLGLSSYLLAPIQRLGKYLLLLEKLQKYEQNSGDDVDGSEATCISRALSMVRNEMRKGNDFIAIDSIKKSKIDLTQQGSFLMREKFVLQKPKKFESMVFLFEKIIVFTTPDQDDVETFVYQDSIYLSHLSILMNEEHPTIFHLIDFPKNKAHGSNEYTYVLEAKTHKIKEVWTQQIENLLWKQLQQYKDQITRLQRDESGKTSQSLYNTGQDRNTYKKKKQRCVKRRSKFYDTM